MQTEYVPPGVSSVTAGLIPSRKALAADLGTSERTIVRYEHMGLPVIVVGMLRMYDPARVRGWLETQERAGNAAARKPGRPRNLITKSR